MVFLGKDTFKRQMATNQLYPVHYNDDMSRVILMMCNLIIVYHI